MNNLIAVIVATFVAIFATGVVAMLYLFIGDVWYERVRDVITFFVTKGILPVF